MFCFCDKASMVTYFYELLIITDYPVLNGTSIVHDKNKIHLDTRYTKDGNWLLTIRLLRGFPAINMADASCPCKIKAIDSYPIQFCSVLPASIIVHPFCIHSNILSILEAITALDELSREQIYPIITWFICLESNVSVFTPWEFLWQQYPLTRYFLIYKPQKLSWNEDKCNPTTV